MFGIKHPFYLIKNKLLKILPKRFDNYGVQPNFVFPNNFDGIKPNTQPNSRPKVAIIREKGSNSERETQCYVFSWF